MARRLLAPFAGQVGAFEGSLYEAKGWVVSDDVPAHLDPDHQGEPAAEPAEDSPAPAPVETTDDTAPADDDEEEVIERG